MMQKFHSRFVSALVFPGLLGLVLLPCLKADDWPAWRGPDRNGISKETGWLTQWPATGPKKLWTAKCGIGFSSFSVSQGRLYTMGNINEMDNVFCFDAENGKSLWTHPYPCSAKDPNDYRGTRATPTVDGNRVYTLSRQGHFFCLDAEKGTVIWSKEFKKDFGGVVPQWGFAGSPWIEKDWVLTETGGKGASVVAFNKMTGEVVWKNGDDPAAYSSIIAFDLDGERCFAQFSADHIIGRRMKDGSELWRLPWKTQYAVNAATPIIQGDEMFLSSDYDFGCAVLKMTTKEVKQVWRNKNMRNHANSCVLLNGYLYGYDMSQLKCLDWKDGTVKWSNGGYGKGAVISASGKLILYSENAKLGLADASPDGFKELCKFQAIPWTGGKQSWAAPVLANGRLYVRNMETLQAFDVKGN